MAFELKEGGGSLFKNDKEGNENRPDYRGEILVGGKLYWLSAWVKEGRKGKFFSLSAKPKEDKAPDVLPKTTGGVAAIEEDLPFN
jgi:hypothetical protein